jgi:hypothetical protein
MYGINVSDELPDATISHIVTASARAAEFTGRPVLPPGL